MPFTTDSLSDAIVESIIYEVKLTSQRIHSSPHQFFHLIFKSPTRIILP